MGLRRLALPARQRVKVSLPSTQTWTAEMAVVISFEKDSAKKSGVHPTEVMVYWLMLPDRGRGPILEIYSLKSGDRKKPGSQSHIHQTFQFTRDSAHELFEILKAEFKF